MNPATTTKIRFDFIDLLKGLCILMVVWGHTFNQGYPFMTIFRMPLYFFLSGLFFSGQKSFQSFFLKRVNNLIVPFVFFFVISLLYHFCLGSINGNTQHLTVDRIFNEYIVVNAPIWFLISLFEVSVIYYFTSLIKNIWLRTGIIIALSYTGFLLGSAHINLPVFLDSSLTSLIFFHTGVLMKRAKDQLFFNSKLDFPIMAVSLLGFILIAGHIGKIDLRVNHIDANYLFYISGAIFAILFLFILCKRINSIKLINSFGRNSIVILGFHMPILEVYRQNFKPDILIDYLFIAFVFFFMYFVIRFSLKFYPQYIAQKSFFESDAQHLYLNFNFRRISIPAFHRSMQLNIR